VDFKSGKIAFQGNAAAVPEPGFLAGNMFTEVSRFLTMIFWL
jgi:hypothetical protein